MDGLSHLLAQMDSAKPCTGTSRQSHAVPSTLHTAASNPSPGSKLEGKAIIVLRNALLLARLEVHVAKRKELGSSAQDLSQGGILVVSFSGRGCYPLVSGMCLL